MRLYNKTRVTQVELLTIKFKQEVTDSNGKISLFANKSFRSEAY